MKLFDFKKKTEYTEKVSDSDMPRFEGDVVEIDNEVFGQEMPKL